MEPVSPGTSRLDRLEPTPLAWRAAIALTVLALGGAAYFFRDRLGARGVAYFGVPCFVGVVAVFSANLRAISWHTILSGLVLQILLALVILKLGFYRLDENGVEYFYRPGYEFFSGVGKVVEKFLAFTDKGAEFVFGAVANEDKILSKTLGPRYGFIFAFKALPTIIFVSSFFTVLYYFGVLQLIVRLFAAGMMVLMRTSGAETLSGVANVFMGQTEAPLIVKPYVPRMTVSEMLAMMVGGMATISGGVMAVYIQLGADPVAILATSVMAAPCGLYLSKLLLPELDEPETRGSVKTEPEQLHRNVVDAAAGGASDGMMLALNVAAMLIAFLAFIALFDYLLGIPFEQGWVKTKWSLTYVFSKVFAPVAFLMGTPEMDIPYMADLLGTKLVANEFVAYIKLTSAEGGYRNVLSPRAYVLATYALTGFANIASIGIQIGGIGGLAPSRRGDLARLGLRALLAGFIATLVNASLAGILMDD